jgi:predicted acetyltransferase
MARLTPPTGHVRDSFLQAAADLRAEGWLPTFPVEKVAADFDGYVAAQRADSEGWGVPITALWYVEGDEYLGTVIVRHRLTDVLVKAGGHIGYHVAPKHRRQGHATRMLADAIDYCRGIGLADLLVTCQVGNVASRLVIEANGGILEDVADGECRYWIATRRQQTILGARSGQPR